MSSRYSTEERVQLIFWYAKFENVEEVRRQWKKHFGTDPPERKTISRLVQKFQETGSVQDQNREGRPVSVTGEGACAMVEQLVSERPDTSTRRGSLEAGMSRSSYMRVLGQLDLKCFLPQFVVELSDDDCDRRAQFATDMLDKFEQDPDLLGKIIWSDEAEFKLSGHVNRHNCSYWAKENPHNQIPLKHSPMGVMVWCGISPTGLIGPYFFEGPVTGQSYTAMLEEFLWPRIRGRGRHFQQDGAPAHYSNVTRAWLDQHLPNRWIGRRGHIEWPARSPDLAPCDYFLWGHLRQLVYRTQPSNIPHLRELITAACAEIDNEMCDRACRSLPDRLRECLRLGGSQLTK